MCASGEEPLRQARQALGSDPDPRRRRTRRGDEPGHRSRIRPPAHRTRPGRRRSQRRASGSSATENGNWSSWSPQGRTDAQIAAQLYISVRTVRSHLDRIRDKTGCRRRADLTRLALTAELIVPSGQLNAGPGCRSCG